MGERSPINDTDATGLFIGLRPDTKREHMMQAVLECPKIEIMDIITSNDTLVERYEQKYEKFKKVYPAVKSLYRMM